MDDDELLKRASEITGQPVSTPKPSGKLDVPGTVDDELSKLGYPDASRAAILGNLGRENAWNPNTIFQGHNDPANQARNRGLMSWQGDRRANLENFINKNGGNWQPSEKNLRLQTQFLDNELQSKYPQIHASLTDPNVDVPTASRQLRGYINYVPKAPYNTPDAEYDVKNNRIWAEKALQRGLASGGKGTLDSNISRILGDTGQPSAPPKDDLMDRVGSILGDSQGGQTPPPTVASPQTVQASGQVPTAPQRPLVAPADVQQAPTAPPTAPPTTPVLAGVDPSQLFGGQARVAPGVEQQHVEPGFTAPQTAVQPPVSVPPVQTPVTTVPTGKTPVQTTQTPTGHGSEPVILDDVSEPPPQQVVTPQNEDNAVAASVDIDTKGKTPQQIAAETLRKIAPQYGFDAEKFLAENPGVGLTHEPGDSHNVNITYGNLKQLIGEDATRLLMHQKAVENRVENPTPDLRVGHDWVKEDAQNLTDTANAIGNPVGSAVATATGLDPRALSNLFGDTAASAVTSALNAGGNTSNAVAGLLKVIGDLSPTKGDSMAEAAHLKPYRAGQDIVDYLKGIADTTSRLAANTGTKENTPATADDKGYLEGRPVERSSIGSKIGGAIGGLADLPRIALMPGGPASPILSFATDSALQAAANGDTVDWSKVEKSGAKGGALGAVSMLAPGVGSGADTVLGTLLNRASSNVIKEGVTLGTIAGGTYGTARAFGDSPTEAFDQAVMMSAFHAWGLGKEKVTDIPIRVKDTNGNEAVINIDKDGTVKTLDPTTEAKAQIVIPKPDLIQKPLVPEKSLIPSDSRELESDTQPETPKVEAPSVDAKDTSAPKEPWQMTRDEAINESQTSRRNRDANTPVLVVDKETGKPVTEIKQSQVSNLDTTKYEPRAIGGGDYVPADSTDDGGNIALAHKQLVEQAIANGKPVPTEVLRDYPELTGASVQANLPPDAHKPEVANKVAEDAIKQFDEAKDKKPWQMTKADYVALPTDRSHNPEINLIHPEGKETWTLKDGREVPVMKIRNEDAYKQKLITKKDYLAKKYSSGLGNEKINHRQVGILEHRSSVYNALLEGEKVPANVLADYPEYTPEFIKRHQGFNKPFGAKTDAKESNPDNARTDSAPTAPAESGKGSERDTANGTQNIPETSRTSDTANSESGKRAINAQTTDSNTTAEGTVDRQTIQRKADVSGAGDEGNNGKTSTESKGNADTSKVTPETTEVKKGKGVMGDEPPKTPIEAKQPTSNDKGVSKIGKSIEQKTIEKGLVDSFDRTAEFDRKHVDEQKEKVAKLVTDPERVRNIINGTEQLPRDIDRSMFIRGVELHADTLPEKEQVQLHYELGNSDIVRQTSEAAQTLRFAQERERDSTTKMMQEVRKARIAEVKNLLKGRSIETAIKEEAANLARTVKGARATAERKASTRQSWHDFISSLEC